MSFLRIITKEDKNKLKLKIETQIAMHKDLSRHRHEMFVEEPFSIEREQVKKINEGKIT